MTDKTQPEAGSTHIIRYALELGLLWIDGDGRNKVREALDALDALEAKLASIGAGGVQALSAAPEIHEPKCPALDGAGCTCAKHDPTIDRAWAQFCGGIGDGLDAPYPGMISAFERYYSQSFADKAWRNEASVWAAAWKAALLAASPTPPAEQHPPRCRYCDGTGDVHSGDGEWRGICTECEAGTALHQQAVPKAAPVKACVCGEPQAPGTVHRVDGPCYVAAPQQEAQEPYAYAVYFPDQPTVELVHDLDELTDDLTNREHQITKLYTAPQPAPAELEQLRERISRMGLDVDRAMRGHVNEQSPLGTTRLAAIAALAKPAPAPLSDDAERDAARYRWLREGNDAKHGAAWHVAVNLYGCEWDAAIDAAIAAQGGK